MEPHYTSPFSHHGSNFFQSLQFKNEAGSYAYVLIGASFEFQEDVQPDIRSFFERRIQFWKDQSPGVLFGKRFHFEPYANNLDGEARVQAFLEIKSNEFGL